jgi:hypothetical protein
VRCGSCRQCELAISTCSAAGSRRVRRSTMPSARGQIAVWWTVGGNGRAGAARKAARRGPLRHRPVTGRPIGPLAIAATSAICASPGGCTAGWESTGEPSVTTPAASLRPPRRERPGEHAAAAVPDDRHGRARRVRRPLQALLQRAAGLPEQVTLARRPARGPPAGGAQAARDRAARVSAARKPGTSRTGRPPPAATPTPTPTPRERSLRSGPVVSSPSGPRGTAGGRAGGQRSGAWERCRSPSVTAKRCSLTRALGTPAAASERAPSPTIAAPAAAREAIVRRHFGASRARVSRPSADRRAGAPLACGLGRP